MNVRSIIAATAAFLLSAQAASSAEYRFVYVDAFQGDYDLRESYLFDVNNVGAACGWATDLPSYSGFRWAQATDKTKIPFTLARGINDAGKIVGLDKVYDPATGDLVTLPKVAVAPPVALDINNNDVVVGYDETCICSNSDFILQVPFVWDAVHGARAVNVPNAKELVKVNDANVAVGIIRGGPHDGFVYDIATGRSILLSPYLPPNQYPWNEAADINDLGVVVGKHRGADFTTFDGFLWTEAGGATLLPHFPGGSARSVLPAAINDAGVVVGRAEVSPHVYQAFVWSQAKGIRDLNAALVDDVPAGFILDRALEINDQGWIVGDGHFGPNWSSSQAFVLIPNAVTGVTPGASAALDLRIQPNPSHGMPHIEYSLPAGATGRIEVFDARGRLVTTLFAAADRVATLQEPLPTGIYLARLTGAAGTITRKFLVLP
jgi:probable HAF family extracellular repeat protein